MIGEPLSIGTPATQTLSLTPTVRPASGPSAAPGIEHFHAQPLLGFSSPTGRWPVSARGYLTGSCSSGSSSSRRKPASVGPAASAKTSSSSSVRGMCNESAIHSSCCRVGGWTGMAPPSATERQLTADRGALRRGHPHRVAAALQRDPERVRACLAGELVGLDDLLAAEELDRDLRRGRELEPQRLALPCGGEL